MQRRRLLKCGFIEDYWAFNGLKEEPMQAFWINVASKRTHLALVAKKKLESFSLHCVRDDGN